VGNKGLLKATADLKADNRVFPVHPHRSGDIGALGPALLASVN
jgi:hypothetical protein